MNIKTLVANGLLAALYIAITMLIQPISFTNIQLRIPEMLNHLVVFNKKYIYGIVLGVFLANLFFSPIAPYDLTFGVGQSILSLLITIMISKYIKGVRLRMIMNTAVFTVTMFLIAIELHLAYHLPFFFTWLTTAIGECIVMAVGAPIMSIIDKRIHFKTLI
ncbi:membrane protein [Pullulanibacillus camelliae]|uniref:Membrane protein n=1 Tax=Pullulanibacillus camelliae TaxID=1707096 RepID=A0A8J2VN36_9BACL|nr:QueT transporter family protein [Pullulanibacillus camelliae]GGE34571.1 membrane protein [Pullulanibacillus camelliae]